MLLNNLSKRDESFTIHTYDNGYMVEIPGRDSNDDWITVKLICSTIGEVLVMIEDINKIEVNR